MPNGSAVVMRRPLVGDNSRIRVLMFRLSSPPHRCLLSRVARTGRDRRRDQTHCSGLSPPPPPPPGSPRGKAIGLLRPHRHSPAVGRRNPSGYGRRLRIHKSFHLRKKVRIVQRLGIIMGEGLDLLNDSLDNPPTRLAQLWQPDEAFRLLALQTSVEDSHRQIAESGLQHCSEPINQSRIVVRIVVRFGRGG